MTKAELDADYADKLMKLQQECDHVLTKSIMVGHYGCDCYGECDLCEAEIHFDAKLERDSDGSIEIVTWRRLGGSIMGRAIIHRVGIFMSHYDIEKYYKDKTEFNHKMSLVKTIEFRIKGKVSSVWDMVLEG